MAEQTKQKKKWINFKFGIRKEFFRTIIFMGIFMGVILAMVPIFGMNNGMAVGISIMGIMMGLSNDYTMQPIRNLLMLVFSNMGMIFICFLGYGLFPEHTWPHIIMMTAATLVCFFLAIYLFTSEERSNTYMPLLMGFSLLLYFNGNTKMAMSTSVSAPIDSDNVWLELLIRLAIYGIAGIIGFLLNMIMHGWRYVSKTRKALTQETEKMETLCDSVLAGNVGNDQLKVQNEEIEKSLDTIENGLSTKLSMRPDWKIGYDLIRAITILKRINHSILRYCVEEGNKMTQDRHDVIIRTLDAMVEYEKKHITLGELQRQFDKMHQELASHVDHGEVMQTVQQEIASFNASAVTEQDEEELRMTPWQWIVAHINQYNLIFALKYSLLAAAGVFVVEALALPRGYIFPLYVALTAQPYVELSKNNAKNRIINTIYAVVIILIAFSIPLPGKWAWAHVLIVLAITLIADMFFQFNFMMMMGTMFSVIIVVLTHPGDLYAYSLLRFGYIAVACLLVQFLDMAILPRQIPATVAKQLKESLSWNQKLRAVLATPTATFTQLHDTLADKRLSDQRLKNTNRYAKNDIISNYLNLDVTWMNGLAIVSHHMRVHNETMGELQSGKALETGGDDVALRQQNVMITLNEALKEMNQAEDIAKAAQEARQENLAEKAKEEQEKKAEKAEKKEEKQAEKEEKKEEKQAEKEEKKEEKAEAEAEPKDKS